MLNTCLEPVGCEDSSTDRQLNSIFDNINRLCVFFFFKMHVQLMMNHQRECKKVPENYRIDNLDQAILTALMDNARIPYAELAKQLAVSPGTIHVRVEKMKQAGIIEGTRVQVNPRSSAMTSVALSGSTSRAPRITVGPGQAAGAGRGGGGLLHHGPLQHLHEGDDSLHRRAADRADQQDPDH